MKLSFILIQAWDVTEFNTLVYLRTYCMEFPVREGNDNLQQSLGVGGWKCNVDIVIVSTH